MSAPEMTSQNHSEFRGSILIRVSPARVNVRWFRTLQHWSNLLTSQFPVTADPELPRYLYLRARRPGCGSV